MQAAVKVKYFDVVTFLMQVYILCLGEKPSRPDAQKVRCYRPEILVPVKENELLCRGYLSFYGDISPENYEALAQSAKFVDAYHVKCGRHPVMDRPIIIRDASTGNIVIKDKYYSEFELINERPITLVLDIIPKRDRAAQEMWRMDMDVNERLASRARLDEYNHELFYPLVDLRKMTHTEWCV
jgi:hypothetical protein